MNAALDLDKDVGQAAACRALGVPRAESGPPPPENAPRRARDGQRGLMGLVSCQWRAFPVAARAGIPLPRSLPTSPAKRPKHGPRGGVHLGAC